MDKPATPEPTTEVRAVLDSLARATPIPMHRMPVKIARALFEIMAPRLDMPEPPVAKTERVAISSADGTIPADVIWPAEPAAGRAPVIVYFHGGGWVLGSTKTHGRICRYLANRAKAVVVNVEYRRAPESPFPAALEDARAAVEWVGAHTDDLCVDAAKIFVAGDSAGGNLATVTAQALRSDGPDLAGQILIYPVTDLENERPSRRELDKGYFLERKGMRWFKRRYLKGATPADPRVSPILAPDLSGLAPAYVLTAELDPLRDEGVAYADRLQAAGNAVTHRQWPGMIHGFLNMSGRIPEGHRALDEIAEWVAARAQT